MDPSNGGRKKEKGVLFFNGTDKHFFQLLLLFLYILLYNDTENGGQDSVFFCFFFVLPFILYVLSSGRGDGGVRLERVASSCGWAAVAAAVVGVVAANVRCLCKCIAWRMFFLCL